MPNPETAAFDPNDMIVGDYPVQSVPVTIAAGQTIVRGSVLGQITSGGAFVVSLTGASDGSQTPKAIAAVDITTGGSAGVADVYMSGVFDSGKLTYGASHNASTVAAALIAAGGPLFVVTPEAA